MLHEALKSKVRSLRSKVRSLRSEVRCMKSEVRSRRTANSAFQHPFRVSRRDTGHLPEVPALARSSHFPHHDQAVGRRLLQPALPSRDHHRRAVQVLSELELIQSAALAQRSNAPRPRWQGSGHELSRPSHSWQDNKCTLTLRMRTFPYTVS